MLPVKSFLWPDICDNRFVPRQNPVPKREVDICNRLREARRETRLSQAAFAEILGIHRDRLATYEHARVPVRAGVALMAARHARVSLRWLAEGLEPKQLETFVHKRIRERIDENRIFSEVYDTVLKPLFDEKLDSIAKNSGAATPVQLAKILEHDPCFGFIGDLGPEDVVSAFEKQLLYTLEDMPPQLFPKLYSALNTVLRDFRSRNAEAIKTFADHLKPKHETSVTKTYDLTEAESSNTTFSVKPQLPDLLDRLQKATAQPGKKTELAKSLKVPLASVSRWLSGEREPGGEVALQMLHWVEHEERK